MRVSLLIFQRRILEDEDKEAEAVNDKKVKTEFDASTSTIQIQ
jgi:hypothetical protein